MMRVSVLPPNPGVQESWRVSRQFAKTPIRGTGSTKADAVADFYFKVVDYYDELQGMAYRTPYQESLLVALRAALEEA